MSSPQPTTTLSKALLTGPNLAYSLALHDTLKKLDKMGKETPGAEHNIMMETVIMSILSQPAIGDA